MALTPTEIERYKRHLVLKEVGGQGQQKLKAARVLLIGAGGLGSPLGPLVAGIIIGVSEAITMAVASPSWAPIVSFSLLIIMLLLRPGKG
jgi:molybdopterin/thiamine biosynthesis adenylyltransferase